MDNKYINIEQAFYGDIGKSHGCIAATFRDSDLNSFLTAFTDRPGAIPAGTIMEPYLSGQRFDGKYVFTKTFPDFAAIRGGMVFTHVLVMELSDLNLIKELSDLLTYFVNDISKQTALETISFIPSGGKKNDVQEFFPYYIQEILQGIITEKLPVIFCGKLISFQEVLCAIWPGLPLGLKKNFSYTAGFSLSSLDRLKTMVYFQENLKPILQNSIYVEDSESKIVQIESEIEKFVLFNNTENVFEEFINDLNIQLTDWSILTPAVKAFQLFQKIDFKLSQDETRLLVRYIAKISPESSSGKVIKNKLILKLANSISSEENSNIKSLSNLALDGFPEGPKIIGSAIEKFTINAFQSVNNFQGDALHELLKLTDGHKTDWWRDSVLKGVSKVFSKVDNVSISNAWQIFLKPESSMVTLLSFIPADNGAEKIFIESMPKSITKTIAEKVAFNIRDKNWFILHSHLLLQYLSAKEAIKVQIGYERSSRFVSFEGSHLLLTNLSDTELLSVTLDMGEDLLIKEYANRASAKPILLKPIDVNESVWLEIWSECLTVSKNLAYGIENLGSTFEKVLRLIEKGITIPERILLLFSESDFADLSGYQNRKSIWRNLPHLYIKKFQEATAIGCMKKILNAGLVFDEIEQEIKIILGSDDFITVFLSVNRANMNVVLAAFSNIPDLKDKHLSDYIHYFSENLSELESAKLGDVVLDKKFATSARQIFEKAKNNPQYRIALNNCKPLINFSFYEKLMNGSLFGEQVSADAVYSEILSKVLAMYPQGPEHSDIWKRAGGDISKFINQKSREDNWKHGISLLRNGGGGANLSAGSLLRIMIEDYPQNNELIELKKYFK